MNQLQKVEAIVAVLLDGQADITPELINQEIERAERVVEESSGVDLEHSRADIDEICMRLIARHCLRHKHFKVYLVSENTNSFGLTNYIFVAADGEAWQAARYRPLCSYERGSLVRVPLIRGEPDFSTLGFEIPEQKPQAPAELVAELWRK